jgi:negative regulator of sigma E activity
MNVDELWSAGLDGELGPEELDRLLDGLERDEAAGKRWQRWSAVRAAREGVRVDLVSAAWSSGVLDALKHVTPDALPVHAPVRSSMARPARSALRRRRRWTSVALAASVLAMATGGVVAVLTQGSDATFEADLMAPPVTADASTFDTLLASQRTTAVDVETAQPEGWLINDYFLAHHQMAGAQTVGGTLRRAQFDVVNEHAVLDGELR